MKQFLGLMGSLAGLVALCAAGQLLDGMRVDNGGSTNTAPWTLWLRSDGSGRVYGDPSDHPFTVSPELAARTFSHLAAARAAIASAEPCMKSASFGSRTTVMWHGWQSPDLSCPQRAPALAALAADIAEIQALAQIRTAPRRPLLPNEPRRAPSEGQPPTPTPVNSPAKDRELPN
jgi:hypothetical protein